MSNAEHHTVTGPGAQLAWDEDTVAEATATLAEPDGKAWNPHDFEVTVEYASAAFGDDTASTVLGKGLIGHAASSPARVAESPATVAEGSSPNIDVTFRGDDEPTEALPELRISRIDPISPASVSLIADAEAVLAAFREPPPPTWAQQMALQCVSLPEPPAPKQSWLRRTSSAVVDFADRVGGRVVEKAEGLYRWVEASRFGQAMRRRPCRHCNAPRETLILSFALPNLSIDQLRDAMARRAWDLFRTLPPASSENLQLQLSLQSCNRCGKHRTLELTWVQGSWRRTVVKGIDLADAESFFLLSLVR